ncbi:GNAT family N-acetyltransferase [Streptomyces sp. NPDC006879]|uniref:GNAT family N-acetyltransferase n=1 Tax=Streptomyces sp. NPDC006879 TaxID=3364767 RepID=UPI00368F7137
MAQSGPRWQVLSDDGGRPVVTCRWGVREGRPWARVTEVTGPAAAELILDELSGWTVTAPLELGDQLVRRGARMIRHAHEMSRDLAAAPPPPAWDVSSPATGLRHVHCDRDATALFPAWRAAFPPGHIDHYEVSDEEALTTELIPLLSGRVLGPVMACSALTVDEADRVIAGVIVTDREGLPWVADVFRDPDAAYVGLGAALLRKVLRDAAGQGLARIALSVSAANPAHRLYEKLGFRTTSTNLTVDVP